MKTFVFDENFDDQRIIERCNAEAFCSVERYPKHLKGRKDPEILPIVLSGDRPFVTLDGVIVEAHRECIPIENPGVIIIKLRRPTRTMTTRLGAVLLSEFKKRYPNWPDEDTAGLKLEINESGVMLSLISSPRHCIVIDYSNSQFELQTRNALERLRKMLSHIVPTTTIE